MKSWILLSLVGIIIALNVQENVQAQSDTLIRQGITHISATRQGQILAADDQSNIFLYDTNGVMLYQYSPRRPARIHLLEGWNGLRPFAFYRDFQEFVVLDRFLLADENTRINTETIGYARLVAPSQDGNLWVLDESNFQLKKVELKTQKVLFSTPLDLILKPGKYSLSFMREYQNQLYLCDSKGPVLQFDMMGNFKKKWPLTGLNWMGFQDEMAYGLQNDSLVTFDPHRFQVEKSAFPFAGKGIQQLLKMGNRWFGINREGLHLWILDTRLRK